MQPNDETSITISLADLWALLMMQRLTILTCLGGAVVLAVLYSLLATPMYRATSVVQLSIQAGQEIQAAKVVDLDQYNRWNRDMFVQTNLEILVSRKTREEVLDRYVSHLASVESLPDEDEITRAGPDILESLMNIEARENSELIDLSIEYSDPERAAILANLLAEVYREQNLEKLQDAAVDARAWLEEEMADYERRLSDRADELAKYQVDNEMLSADRNVETLKTHLDMLKEESGSQKTELAMERSQHTARTRLTNQGNYDELAKQLDTPLIQAITAEKAKAVTRHAEVTARYGEAHPRRQAVEAELARYENELKREVEKALSAQMARIGVLAAGVASLEDEMAEVSQKLTVARRIHDGYERLEREHERIKRQYVQLSQRYDELDLQSRTQLNNVRILDAAQVPENPYSPRLLFNVAVAAVFGLITGVSLGLLREYLDDTISTPLDVSAYLHVPYLGHVPRIEKALAVDEVPELYTFARPKSLAAESMRAIRTIIDMPNDGVDVRRLLVTSAVSSEGKTGTSVRVGVTFAQLGRRVLVIDADLRRPRLHRVFGFERGPGLTEVLNEAPLEDAVRVTRVPNLWVLPVGGDAHRSTELLATPAMRSVIQQAEQAFDMVIIDTPPSTLIADAAILSRSVDGILLVVRENAASRRLVQRAVADLRRVGGRILGVVINDVDLKRSRNSYRYYYGYGRRYYAEETSRPAAK